jgi:hypothetical protein
LTKPSLRTSGRVLALFSLLILHTHRQHNLADLDTSQPVRISSDLLDVCIQVLRRYVARESIILFQTLGELGQLMDQTGADTVRRVQHVLRLGLYVDGARHADQEGALAFAPKVTFADFAVWA